MERLRLKEIFRFGKEPKALFEINNLTSGDEIIAGLDELSQYKQSKEVKKARRILSNKDLSDAVINGSAFISE